MVYANETGLDEAVKAIHKQFTYRMHDLGEVMKGLLQRFTKWFNRTHSRTGRAVGGLVQELNRGGGIAPGATHLAVFSKSAGIYTFSEIWTISRIPAEGG